MSALDEAVQKYEASLTHVPSNTIDRVQPLHALATALWNRYCQQSSIEDLEKAITNSEEAETIANLLDHPFLTWASQAISRSTDSSEEYFDITTSQKFNPCTRRLASFINTSADERYHLAVNLARAAHSTIPQLAVRAYRTALYISERCLAMQFNVENQYQFITEDNYHSMVRDAAACAIECGELAAAVELLEQGRGQIWSRLRDNAFPLSSLPDVDERLIDAFRQTLAQLYLLSPESSAIKSVTERWNTTVDEIRELESFGDFLRPRRYKSIRAAAAEGPVVIVNISQYRCDALVVWRDAELPFLIPLSQSLYDTLPRLSKTMLQVKGFIRASQPWIGHRLGPTQALTSILAELWNYVGEPVVTYLLGEGCPKQSRLWWSPTGALASLPVHAAGDYDKQGVCLPDLFVSSYAPTLSSIIRARASLSDLANVVRGNTLLAIAQSNSLPQAKAELQVLEQLFAKDALLLDHEKAKPDPTMLHDHAWLHFACHGFLNVAQPLDSYLELYGGNLKLKDIVNDGRVGQRGELAFLATCQSAASEIESAPDEIISLASAMQGIGFRSVIGTLWAMSDRDGPALAKRFYGYLLKKGIESADVKQSAMALHLATNAMREEGIPAERWCTFIHLGI